MTHRRRPKAFAGLDSLAGDTHADVLIPANGTASRSCPTWATSAPGNAAVPAGTQPSPEVVEQSPRPSALPRRTRHGPLGNLADLLQSTLQPTQLTTAT